MIGKVQFEASPTTKPFTGSRAPYRSVGRLAAEEGNAPSQRVEMVKTYDVLGERPRIEVYVTLLTKSSSILAPVTRGNSLHRIRYPVILSSLKMSSGGGDHCKSIRMAPISIASIETGGRVGTLFAAYCLHY